MTETVPFTFIQPCGEEKEIQGEIGKNLLDIAHENDIELEGACLQTSNSSSSFSFTSKPSISCRVRTYFRFNTYFYWEPSIGACGGELACATCHLIFEEEMFNTLSEKDEEEDDMLDLAFELTET